MKKWKTFLEDRGLLTLILLALAALTVTAAAVVYEKNSKKADEQAQMALYETQTEENSEPASISGENVEVNAENGTGTSMEALAQNDTEVIPDAEEVGNSIFAGESAENAENSEAVNSGQVAAANLSFQPEEKLSWPTANREILMGYSMDSLVYFATLEQYKVNPSVLIQAETGSPVTAPAAGLVSCLGCNEEIGNYAVLTLGNDYSLLLGNLTGLEVTQGQYVGKGAVIGSVAAPTKYYSVEGPNVYLEVFQGEAAVDPLDYLE